MSVYPEGVVECWYCGELIFEDTDYFEEDGHYYHKKCFEKLQKEGEL